MRCGTSHLLSIGNAEMFSKRLKTRDIDYSFKSKCFLSRAISCLVSEREIKETPDHQDLQPTLVTWALLFKVTPYTIQMTNLMGRSRAHCELILDMYEYCLFSDWLQDYQVTQVTVDFPVPLVTRELQDIQDHQDHRAN